MAKKNRLRVSIALVATIAAILLAVLLTAHKAPAGVIIDDGLCLSGPTICPPETSINSGPPQGWTLYTDSVTFGFSSNEIGSTFQCKLDDAAFVSCTSPKSYSGLPDGPHTFQVRAIDPQGDVDSTPESRSWTVDTTQPPPPDTTPPETNQPTGQADFATTARFFLSGSDNMTAPAELKFECRIDDTSDEGWLPCTSPKEYRSLTNGAHFFEVRAKDSAGNVDPTPASRRFTIDTIPPETTITSHPSDPSGATPTFTFSGSEDVVLYQCKYYLTSAGAGSTYWISCTSPYTLSRLTVSGSYTFEVLAYDRASNSNLLTPSSYTWTVDATAPSAPLITSPANNSSDPDGDFTVNGTAEAGSTVELFEGSTSKGTAQVNSSGQWSIRLSGVAEGSHTYTAEAKDAVGNPSAWSNPLSVIVDATAPGAPVISSPQEASVKSGSFVVSGTAEVGSTIELFDGTTSRGTTRTDAQGNWSKALSGVADGSHTYTAKATDAAGNVSTSSNARTVMVDTLAPSAPVITSPANNSFDIDGTITISGTAEANSTVEVFEATASGDISKGTTPVDASGAWTKTLSGVSDGSHTYKGKAKDAAGNVSDPSDPRTVKVDTTAPTAKAPTHTFTTLSTLATSTVPVKLTWSATDNTGGSGIASYQLERSVNGGAYTNVALPSAMATTISPSLSPGTNTYRYRVAAKDNAGNLSTWATGPSFKVSAFQESSSAIVDTGTWTTSALSGAYGGSVQSASALGRNATFTVPSGSKNVDWVSYRGNRGKAQVWLDGVQQDANPSLTGIQPFDLYSSSVQSRKVIFSKAVSATTSHKLEVRVLGQKNGSSTSTRVDIDAFVTTS